MIAKTISSIMLIDDSKEVNFLHKLIIRDAEAAQYIIAMQSAAAALEYLTSNQHNPHILPDLILLDINMPAIDGWEFLDEFGKVKTCLQKTPVIVMLTSSDNPSDRAKAHNYGVVSGYKLKPLTAEMLRDIVQHLF